ncbi:hypothetical protein [Maribacter litoralis]|uniref:hypothetical protein n=1 Tax=Maribacter litoralis TaxID=2059726 RepID=UPI003F5CBDC1
MKAIIFFIFFILLAIPPVFGQIKIGDNPQNIDASSVLELESTSKVLVITRVTTAEMEAISPQRGGMVYNTDTECINYYDGTQWVNLCDAVDFSITNDPIINGRSTIEITESAAGYNLEVAKNSILGDNIIDGGIGPDDIQDNSITQDKLAAASVGSSEISENAVGSVEIRDGSIAPEDIANTVPDQLLTTDENGIVQWEDSNDFYDLTFNKLDTTLTLERSTIAGVSTISLGALIGSDDQQLNLDENILSLENDDTDIDLSTYLQQISINNRRITLTNGGFIDLPAGTVNTDNQTLTLTGNTLAITGGNNVNLNKYLDNTDEQQLSINGNRISLTDGGFVDLPDATENTDNQQLSINPEGTIISLERGSAVTLPEVDGTETILERGNNIVIEGNGSNDDPYIIHADGSGINTQMEVTIDSLVVDDGNGRVGVPLANLPSNGSNNSAVVIANDSLIVEDAGGRLGFLLSELGGSNTLMQVTTDSLVVDDGNGRVGVPLANLPSNGSNNSAVVIANDSLIVEDAVGRLGFLLSELGGSNTLMQVTTDSLVVDDGNGRVGVPLANLPSNGSNNSAVVIANDSLIVEDAGGRLGFLLSELGGSNTLMQVTTDSLVVDDGNGRVGVPLANLPSNGSNNSAVVIANDSLVVEDAGGRLGFLLSELPTLSSMNLTQTLGEDRTYDLNGQELQFTGSGNIGIGNFGSLGSPASIESKLDVDGVIRARDRFRTSSGDAALPGYGFFTNTDNNMGMFRAGIDELAFSTDGVERMRIDSVGRVGIGITAPLENLHVDGNIRADDIYSNGALLTPDYVFQKYFLGNSILNPSYSFKTLAEIEAFVKENNHLPGIQSAQAVKEQGFWNVSESSRVNLEKIEELFLHTIEQEKKIKELQKANTSMSSELEALKAQMQEIKNMVLEKQNN